MVNLKHTFVPELKSLKTDGCQAKDRGALLIDSHCPNVGQMENQKDNETNELLKNVIY